MKLKTLKDIEMDLGIYCNNKLRQEAKRWVKELDFRMSYQEHKHNEKKALLHSIDWIKHFFNLK